MTAFVQWCKGEQGLWCKLKEVEVDHKSLDGVQGVYIIWQDLRDRVVLRVGEGSLRDCLDQEQRNQQLSDYPPIALLVTWAPVNALHRADVARYLAAALKPRLGNRYAEGNQIKVNLPWATH